MDMILGKCKFPNSFLPFFSNICCRYTLELPLLGDSKCVNTTYVLTINEVFIISFFKQTM